MLFVDRGGCLRDRRGHCDIGGVQVMCSCDFQTFRQDNEGSRLLLLTRGHQVDEGKSKYQDVKVLRCRASHHLSLHSRLVVSGIVQLEVQIEWQLVKILRYQ
jgi:hypothetical protein